MKLKHWKYFSGPNVVALRPCVVATLDAKTVDPLPLTKLQRRLADDVLGRSGFAGASETPEMRSASAAGFVAEAAIAVQRRLACPVSWWTASTDGGVDEIAFEIMCPIAAKEILECALVLLAVAQENASAAEFVERFQTMRVAMSLRLHQYLQHDRASTAARLGIESRTGYGMHYSHTRLGQGRHARVLAPGYTDATSHLGKNLSGRKDETTSALLAAGLPVAEQRVAASEADAIKAAHVIGFPVVVKPLRGSRGRQVAVNLGDDESVRHAFRRATTVSPTAVVERYLPGDDFRLLVINGTWVAAVRRVLPMLVGDGLSPVRTLIERENQGGNRNGIFLPPLAVDDEVARTLRQQGLNLDSITDQGRLILVRCSASPESMVIDVSDTVHPDNQALAVLAAETCGLDLAGIDFISTDIATSWRRNGAGIVEVNAGPGVDLHMYPQVGEPRSISWHMIRARVPARSAGRIPVIMVTGRYGKQSISTKVLNLLALLGYAPGVSDQGAPRDEGVAAGNGTRDAVAMLADKSIGAGVVCVSTRTLAKEGCPVNFPSLSVITDEQAAGDELDATDVARVHALAVDSAASAVIIDGTRPRLRTAAARRPAWQVGYVWSSVDADAALEAHVRAGGWAVRILRRQGEGASITLCQGQSQTQLVALNDQDEALLAPGGLREMLFAVATAVALGVSAAVLSRALPAVACASDRTSTLAMNPFGLPATAACDPRDPIGLQRLRAFARAGCNGNSRLWAMVSVTDWMIDLLPDVFARLDSPSTHWCCIASDGPPLDDLLRVSGLDPERVRRYASPGMARDAVVPQMRDGDVLVLIELNEAVRGAWCRPADDGRPPLMTAGPGIPGAKWHAKELAEIFDGFWVSGPGDGWAVQEFARDDEDNLEHKLVVVGDGAADRLAVAEVEARVRAAFSSGAAAVVTRAFPIDLPRYQRVLVCDDIERGMQKLLLMMKS